MSKIISIIGKVPLKYWIVNFCIIMLPLFIKPNNGLSSLIWFLYIIPNVFFTYRFSLQGGLITFFTLTVIYGTHEIINFVLEPSFHEWRLYFFSVMTLVNLVLAVVIGFLVRTLKNKNRVLIELNEQLKRMAYNDILTGLPNRYMLNEYLNEFLDFGEQNNTKFAVLFIDLDRFKFINDTMGHDMGDVLLIKVKDRLVKCVREGDVVSRQGGDEFVILLKDINESKVRDVAERILDSFKNPFLLNNEEHYSSPSIGISLYPKDGNDDKSLIKKADIAMYLAKKRGKNTYQFFIHEPESILDRTTKLEHGLRKALDNNQFVLHYQPQIELETGEWKGVEALLRWNHPEFGLVPPDEFIPIAEETGLIVPIGKWVIETACKQNKEWKEQGFIPLRVAVNVSALQFQDRNFVKSVNQILNEHQLAPEYLELELTESVMQNVKESSEILHQFKKIGVKTSIDDFGTGYSSLNVLNRLPIDFVKIDKSFVNEIGINSNSTSLVKTMIDIGSNLNFELIAEGIEDEIQADFLNKNGCRYGQGYLYSPPLRAEEIEKLIQRQLVRN